MREEFGALFACCGRGKASHLLRPFHSFRARVDQGGSGRWPSSSASAASQMKTPNHALQRTAAGRRVSETRRIRIGPYVRMGHPKRVVVQLAGGKQKRGSGVSSGRAKTTRSAAFVRRAAVAVSRTDVPRFIDERPAPQHTAVGPHHRFDPEPSFGVTPIFTPLTKGSGTGLSTHKNRRSSSWTAVLWNS